MTTFIFKEISTALDEPKKVDSNVDFSGKSLKLDSAEDAQPIVDAINSCNNLQCLTLTGNTLGVAAAEVIAKSLADKHELEEARFSDMFTGRMKTEIPPALSALGDGMIKASAHLRVLDLSDNAFGPVGVQGLAKLLQSNVCAKLQELRLNNNGLGVTGGKLLASALKQMKLKTFVAGRNRLENEGATALSRVFKEMGTLEELTMPQNGIYHVGILALSDALSNNPALTTLNLNDNTIGVKGATSIAKALPRLKNLRCINLGDCLLKSKGALVLASAFRRNSQPIETLDMSHNEINLVGCMELVDALAALPGSGERLKRVALAGNSLGGPVDRDIFKQILGDCAELSDGEENEVYSDFESEEDEDADEEDEHENTVIEDDSALKISDGEKSGVPLFMKEPTKENFIELGYSPADAIDTHLLSIPDPQTHVHAFVEAILLVSGLSTARSSSVAATLYSRIEERFCSRFAVQWTLADAMLRGLALIKSESNQPIRWYLPAVYATLAENITKETFPESLRDTIRLFINSKLPALPDDVQAVVKDHPTLLRDD